MSTAVSGPITPEQLEELLPLACEWAAAQDQRILSAGAPLSSAQLSDARLVGVAAPERVRVLHEAKIPAPEHPRLREAAELTRLISPLTGGMALRYGIFIRADCRGQRALLVHELAHTAQYERLGGFRPFLERYLVECVTIGYPEAPLEQEVVELTARICGGA
jgi:hypothetical protein